MKYVHIHTYIIVYVYKYILLRQGDLFKSPRSISIASYFFSFAATNQSCPHGRTCYRIWSLCAACALFWLTPRSATRRSFI